ncbi:MAG: hypothetical protein M1829_004407 [Trizodia sp. TS-e1964]|nr:MAG: hypothetical protein M1829_004407 [Trizodia sp. TS-e1964]
MIIASSAARNKNILFRSGCLVEASRHYSATGLLFSGHSRWSTIKHDKGKKDAQRNSAWNIITRDIVLASKLSGPDPNLNPRLAALISAAKKTGFPKASIDASIARGQGLSSNGATLENVTLEGIFQSSIAFMIDFQTDSKLRTLMDAKAVIKDYAASASPTSYLFQKRGRIVLGRDERALRMDEILEEALEAEAEDVEVDDEGNFVIWTEPSKTTSIASALSKSLDLKIKSVEIMWDPKEETLVPLESDQAAQQLALLFEKFIGISGMQGIYFNATQGKASDDAWADLCSKTLI